MSVNRFIFHYAIVVRFIKFYVNSMNSGWFKLSMPGKRRRLQKIFCSLIITYSHFTEEKSKIGYLILIKINFN